MCRSAKVAFLVFISLALFNPVIAEQPRQIILTWQNSPQTTMTVTWRTDIKGMQTYVRYHSLEETDTEMRRVYARSFTFRETRAWIHTAELNGLSPSTEYQVYIYHDEDVAEPFIIRTAPDDTRDIVFLVGGDSRTNRNERRAINRLAAAQNPDFVIFSGDMIENPLSEQDWDDWFDDWHELMITSDGRRIPVIPAIGNHEVADGYSGTKTDAPFYYNRFIVPGNQKYYALYYGPLLSIITLDSGHTSQVTGEQTEWLEKTLQKHYHIPWKIVQYHVAAFPSARDFNLRLQQLIRDTWVPLFERYNVDLVCEAHDHAYKRTEPIRDGRIDREHGIVYVGDGAWGAPLRRVIDPNEHWWLAEAASVHHFFKFTLSDEGTSLYGEPIFYNQRGAGGTPFTLTKAHVELQRLVRKPSLISPHSGAEHVPSFIPFRFTSIDDADGYRIQVARNMQFTDLIFDDDSVPSPYVQLAPFVEGDTYYWRVNAYTEGIPGVWSETWSFHTGSEWVVYDTSKSIIPSNNIYSITKSLTGHPWIGTARGLARFHETSLTNWNTANSDLPDNIIRTAATGPDGITWVGTRNGAAVLSRNGWEIFTTNTSPLPHDVVTSIAIDQIGTVWFGTERGAASYDGSVWSVYTKENSGLPGDVIHVIRLDRDGKVWFGTDQGLAVYDYAGWRVYTASSNALPHDNVQAIAFDRMNSVWLGTAGGAARYDGLRWTWFTTQNSGLHDDNISAIVIDRNRTVWFGTDEGVSRFGNNEWITYTPANSGIPDAKISALFEDDRGRIWIGTHLGGVAVFHEKRVRHARLDGPDMMPTSLVLYQNYPNPFNAETIIEFSLPEPGFVELTVYNVLGSTVVLLAANEFPAGKNKVIWNAQGLPSGVYYYQIRSFNMIDRKRMILLQ
jgi:acid phosphatase type 7